MEMKLKDLKFDDELLGMRTPDPLTVSRYRQAYREGKDLGLIIINKKTKEIVSGNHRVIAMVKEFGEDHEIDVEARMFSNRKKVLECFASENVAHGRPLSGKERKAIIHGMISKGVSEGKIASIFGVSVKRIGDIAGEVCMVVGKDKKDPEIRPIKAGLPPDKQMTETQYEEHWKRDRSIKPYAQVEQLIRWIDNGWIDTDCSKTMAAFAALSARLEGILKKQAA